MMKFYNLDTSLRWYGDFITRIIELGNFAGSEFLG